MDLLLMYVQSVSEYEGMPLLSFGRCFGFMSIGGGAILVAWLFDAYRTRGWRGRAALLTTLALAAGLIFVALSDRRRTPETSAIETDKAGVARDRQRVADLAEIQKALEKYAARFGKLPTPASYGEAGGVSAAGFWNTWWDLSAVDANGDGRPFLEVLVDQQIIARVPLDPLNKTGGSDDPRAGQQYVYLVVPAGADYAGGPCRAPDRWHYLLAITDLETETVRPPKGFATSQCSCLWRDKPNFFQEHFDYVLCGSI